MKIEKLKENIKVLPGNNGNSFSSSKRLYNSISITESNTIEKGGSLFEAVDWQVADDEKGGVIIFSTDVNATRQSENKLIDWLKKKAKTIGNRLGYTKKIDKVANDNGLIGWTVGKFLDGRYTAHNGQNFGENSLSVELVGVTTDKLISVAEQLCRLFDQETVLVKDYTTGNILFVNRD